MSRDKASVCPSTLNRKSRELIAVIEGEGATILHISHCKAHTKVRYAFGDGPPIMQTLPRGAASLSPRWVRNFTSVIRKSKHQQENHHASLP